MRGSQGRERLGDGGDVSRDGPEAVQLSSQSDSCHCVHHPSSVRRAKEMSGSEEAAALTAQIDAQGVKIRELKAAKAEAAAVKAEVDLLLALKSMFKEVTGVAFAVPVVPSKKDKEAPRPPAAETDNAAGTEKGGKFKDKKAEKGAKKDKAKGKGEPRQVFDNSDVVVPSIGTLEWTSAGLISALKVIFDAAVAAAFPQAVGLGLEGGERGEGRGLEQSVIIRCNNAAFGDFQCNNAMALSKVLKTMEGYEGPVGPQDVADRIICAIPLNPLLASATSAPNGFINIKLAPATLTSALTQLVSVGVRPPGLSKRRVLVDFSSPNIAKEMHVGHLRSTIIGDSICRILEFCQFDVLRVNHVGDWGTQFGMLITYLTEAYPDILTNPPNISDLTVIYKASKRRFDEDEGFKERSRLNVVKLQGGDEGCRQIWTLLCDISRLEFQKVYDKLGVKVTEVGESFYNPLIPAAIEALTNASLAYEDQGMLIVMLPHFPIPLIVRKSDGGYGYDSTDMAALHYRTQTLQRDWLIYVTDAGQSTHFHMCFDAAREVGWLQTPASSSAPSSSTPVRCDHIGFGVVCGDDGKRFKTRSSETVRLIDLLDAAKDRMAVSLKVRAEEGKSPLQGAELESAAATIGYGAVKYFDLKQNPVSNYIFSYDRMLDTKGDTAVYLLFAYARLVSILRKGEERGIDVAALANAPISLDDPAERAMAFELLQLGDIIRSVLEDLLPNRLCDYLHSLATKFTDFVTRCHVLNVEEPLVHSRLLLCEATRRVMATCFELLGIETLERI